MRAVVVSSPGGPENLSWSEVPDVSPGPGELLLDVVAAGVNRADVMQREGHYPPPPGAPQTLGLECSGTVAALGDGVTRRAVGQGLPGAVEVDGWAVGDQVCALLAGGGCAERVAVPAGQVVRAPEGIDLVDAAGLMETACTVWSTVFSLAGLHAGQTLLVHGGTSGIGTTAIALALAAGARVFTTAGSPEKVALCRQLGAEVAVDYRREDFVSAVLDATDGVGADVVLDVVGGSYLQRNVEVLAADGRLVCLAFPGGRTATLDLGALMVKRAGVFAVGLRSRPLDQKAAIVAGTRAMVWPLLADGRFAPRIDRRVPIQQIADAHRALEAGEVLGKVVLTT